MDVNDFKIKKSQWLMFIIISAGLLYITDGDFIMTLGIMLILIVLDFVLARYIARRKGIDEDKLI